LLHEAVMCTSLMVAAESECEGECARESAGELLALGVRMSGVNSGDAVAEASISAPDNSHRCRKSTTDSASLLTVVDAANASLKNVNSCWQQTGCGCITHLKDQTIVK
jgi:hypothetical protein